MIDTLAIMPALSAQLFYKCVQHAWSLTCCHDLTTCNYSMTLHESMIDQLPWSNHCLLCKYTVYLYKNSWLATNAEHCSPCFTRNTLSREMQDCSILV